MSPSSYLCPSTKAHVRAPPGPCRGVRRAFFAAAGVHHLRMPALRGAAADRQQAEPRRLLPGRRRRRGAASWPAWRTSTGAPAASASCGFRCRATCASTRRATWTTSAWRSCHWDGITAIIRHHKTASTYGTHTITVLEGSRNPDGAAGVCQLGQAAAGEGQHGLRALRTADIYKVCPEARGRCKTVSQRKRDRDCYMWEMIVDGVGVQEWNSMTRLERLRFIQHFRRCNG